MYLLNEWDQDSDLDQSKSSIYTFGRGRVVWSDPSFFSPTHLLMAFLQSVICDGEQIFARPRCAEHARQQTIANGSHFHFWAFKQIRTTYNILFSANIVGKFSLFTCGLAVLINCYSKFEFSVCLVFFVAQEILCNNLRFEDLRPQKPGYPCDFYCRLMWCDGTTKQGKNNFILTLFLKFFDPYLEFFRPLISLFFVPIRFCKRIFL